MKFLPRSIPSVALLVVALVLAASGGAVAAKKITGDDIKKNTVTSKNIKDQTLEPADFSAAAKSSLAGPAGPAGPAGAKGNPGVAGPGFNDFAYFESEELVPANTDDLVGEGTCPTGQSVVSAFAFWNAHNEAIQVLVGFVNATTMGVEAWSTGIADQDTAVLQFSCATLPLPAKPARHMLDSMK